MGSIFIKTPTNLRYNSPTPGEITLMAGKPNLGTNSMDNAFCKTMSECGINAAAVYIGDSGSIIPDTLTNCYNNGIKLFISNYNFFGHTETYVKAYKNHPGLGGWIYSFNLLPGEIFNSGENYEAYKKVVDDLDPEHPIFIGLTGDWKKDSSNKDIESYPDYIANVQSVFEPSFWPFFYFPDLIPLAGNSNSVEERHMMYYKTLQYFAYISRYTGSPFWAYVRCQAFNNYYSYEGPKPTAFIIRGLVFTALAYGAQGIYYSNYRQDSDNGNLKYSDAPVDRNGVKTDTWNILKTINQEVKKYNKIFCGCEVLDCRHKLINPNGNGQDYSKQYKLLDHPMGPLMEVSQHSQNLLISHIFNNGHNYLVVVSDPFVSLRNTIVFQFNEYWDIYSMNSDSEEVKLTSYKYGFQLTPGAYKIFRWE